MEEQGIASSTLGTLPAWVEKHHLQGPCLRTAGQPPLHHVAQLQSMLWLPPAKQSSMHHLSLMCGVGGHAVFDMVINHSCCPRPPCFGVPFGSTYFPA